MAKSYQCEPELNEIGRFPQSHWYDALNKAAELVFPQETRGKEVDEHAVWMNAVLADMTKTEL